MFFPISIFQMYFAAIWSQIQCFFLFQRYFGTFDHKFNVFLISKVFCHHLITISMLFKGARVAAFQPAGLWHCQQLASSLLSLLPNFDREEIELKLAVLPISAPWDGNCLERWVVWREQVNWCLTIHSIQFPNSLRRMTSYHISSLAALFVNQEVLNQGYRYWLSGEEFWEPVKVFGQQHEGNTSYLCLTDSTW